MRLIYKNNVSIIFLALLTLTACSESQTVQSIQQSELSNSQDLDGKSDRADDWVKPKAESNADRCIFDAQDRFEPRSTFNNGPWTGQCHDTKHKRPVGILDDEEAFAYQDPSDYLVIYNVYHNGSFWVAFVPESAISQVYFQLEYFPAIIPAGHTQLRVEYTEPVRLYGHASANFGEYDEVYDLTLSIEAVTQPGDSYDLLKGTQEHFATAYRVTTMEARYEDMVVRQRHHVEQWRLQLETEELEALLFHYVTESEKLQLKYAYHTLFNNCTTEIIEVLDSIAQYSWREQVQRFLVKVTEIYPNIVRAALIARGLLPLDQSSDWYPLEEDEAFISRFEDQ